MRPRHAEREMIMSRDRMMPRADTAEHVHEMVLSLLRHEAPGRLLDLPAGEGAFAEQVKDLGYQVNCGDIDPSRFKVNGLVCEKVDLNEPLPYSANTFDYFVSIEAIEHLENPWLLVREAGRIVKSGGLFVVSTPNVLSLRSRISYLLYGYQNYFHYMVDSTKNGTTDFVDHINPIGFLELRMILDRSGFGIEQVTCNRMRKDSFVYKTLRAILRTRGRTKVRTNQAKRQIRDLLLSDQLMFGEIMIVMARKK